MQMRKILFGLAIALFATTSLVAQDDDAKAKKALDRATKTTTNQMMKHFKNAELTDDQKSKATAIVEKHIKSLMTAKKEQDATLTAEQRKARKEASAKFKKEGLKGQELFKKTHAAMELDEETQKKFDEAKKKVNKISAGMKTEITALLSDEQKAALPKKGKGKGKGKGKKKKDGAADSQSVSLKLPNMT